MGARWNRRDKPTGSDGRASSATALAGTGQSAVDRRDYFVDRDLVVAVKVAPAFTALHHPEGRSKQGGEVPNRNGRHNVFRGQAANIFRVTRTAVRANDPVVTSPLSPRCLIQSPEQG